jgi:hypothetical protein
MYNKISFKDKSDYFSQSKIFNELKSFVAPNNNEKVYPLYYFGNIQNPEEVIDLTLQLLMETIIKHNVSTHMLSTGVTGLDPLRFLSEDNSKEVCDKFESFVNAPRRNKTNPPTKDEIEEKRVFSNLYENVINKLINHIFLQRDVEEIDLCENIKEEFALYVENNATNTKKIKNKP